MIVPNTKVRLNRILVKHSSNIPLVAYHAQPSLTWALVPPPSKRSEVVTKKTLMSVNKG